MDSTPDLKKILKNTIALYLRMAILTIISLYTVRMLLEILGATDYGLNNVVGGLVGLFSFISGALLGAAQRFLSIHIGSENFRRTNILFRTNLLINAGISILFFLIAETCGLQFVFNQLQIPSDRYWASLIVYEVSVIVFMGGVITSSFQAILVAEEDFSIYAGISLLEGIFKILIVFLLSYTDWDKLAVYAILYGVSSLCVDSIYIWYCKKRYTYLKIFGPIDWSLFKEVFDYVKWNFWGAAAFILKGQGVNIIMNIYFGPVVNAARAISIQVSTVIVSFAQNFMQATNPQIFKSYGENDRKRFTYLLVFSSKLAYLLLLFIILPFIANIDYVFELWLITVPRNTIIFTVLVLIDSLIGVLTNPLLTGVEASGKVRLYQLIIGTVELMNCPMAYLLLEIFRDPIIPFAISIVISSVVGVLRIIIGHIIFDLDMIYYLKKAIFPVVGITAIGIGVDLNLWYGARSLGDLIVNCVGSILCIGMLILMLGLSKEDRKVLKSYLGLGGHQ